MNIKLIKQEIEILNSLLTSWNEEKSVSAIERNLALNKLTSLYELIGFDNTEVPVSEPEAVIPVGGPTQEIEEENEEQEVEVEIIFADEDEDSEESVIEEEPEPEVEAEIEATVETEPKVESNSAEESVVANNIETATNIEAETIDIVTEAAPTPEESSPIDSATNELRQEEIPPVQPAEKPHTENIQQKSVRKPTMESLFSAEEIQRKPRSKHQRMMAIYGEAQPKQEKVVDISKIFDMEENTTFEVSANDNPKVSQPNATEEKTTLAEAIAPATTTLAESLAAPAALAEEIESSKINSLHQAIGINDKFLMIRDLFDGDNEAYDEAIATLDKLPSLEECMIHIIENYEWNPDVEGSKFIMKLLERKFS